MGKGPIRRSQLIAPFGVGALSVTRDGTSVITAGLDHWFPQELDGNLDYDEFRVEEWRLQKILNVGHFRLPPDFRQSWVGDKSKNLRLEVPFQRFPTWSFCTSCQEMLESPLSLRENPVCPACLAGAKKWKVKLNQVPLVAMCDHGHVQDFPWREWVHGEEYPSCNGKLKLYATGGASLASQTVQCTSCGKKRNLAGVMEAASDGTSTTLSDRLCADKGKFLCKGWMPWLGSGAREECHQPIRASLRSASNLFFSDVRSALYLPRMTSLAPSALVSLLENPPLSTLIKLLQGIPGVKVTPEMLRGQQAQLLLPYNNEEIQEAIRIVTGEVAGNLQGVEATDDDPETRLRREEFQTIRSPRNEADLLVKEALWDNYDSAALIGFDKVMLVHKLRETRAFAGFSRVFPESGLTLQQRKEQLRKVGASGGTEKEDSWLPAYVVYGEGLYFELEESRLRQWERLPSVQERIGRLDEEQRALRADQRRKAMRISPRLVLLHTLSHLLINRLTFECGYSTAALRERLFVSDTPERPMAGLLIYTAAGDAEGTMGGLVRMGKPGNLEPLLRRALEAAQWCSVDPICMETGRSGGQGPDSCNLAACHCCALVPETACELFNRFLDRACVVGDLEDPSLGYFQPT